MSLSKLAFALVTLGLSIASIAAGCKGSVEVNGQDANCPKSFPDDQACSEAGLTCRYEAAGCELVYECDGSSFGIPTSGCATACMTGDLGSACLDVDDTCTFGDGCYYEEWYCGPSHIWEAYYYDDGECCYGECECNPAYCPDSPPSEGTACDPCYDSGYCVYTALTACGDQSVTVGCGADYVWSTITPLAPCPCESHMTVEECEADTACRYLTGGGCDAPSLEVGGCFPKDDCAADQVCPDGKVCTTVNANLCTLDPCIECAAVSLCL